MIITFTGDISITGSFIKKMEANEEIFSPNIIEVFKNSSYVVANLEGPVTDTEPDSSDHIKIKSPSKTIQYLAKRKLNVFNLANNHILDCKTDGLNDTLDTMKQNNCSYFGAGKNVLEASQACVLEQNNCKIALFGITVPSVNIKGEEAKVFTSKELVVLKKEVQNLSKNVDYIIVNYHGGEEFTNYPSPNKRSYLKKISKIKGVDIVIAHHSHTLQAYEKYKGKYIFYSLGNFIFDIPAHYPYAYTKESALLKFTFSKNNFTFDWIPFSNENGKIIDTDFSKFETYFNNISNFNNYKQKWRAEAYRVLFRRNLIQTKEVNAIDTSNSLQEKTLLRLLFSKKFYTKTIAVLQSDNYRSLYISAIIHKIKRIVSRTNL